MEIEIPEVDSQSGLKLCDGEIKIYLQSLRLFAANMPETLNKMRSVTENNLSNYTVSVHGLKGMCVYIGAEKARAAAKELEDLSRSGDINTLLVKNNNFIIYVETIIKNISIWLKNNG